MIDMPSQKTSEQGHSIIQNVSQGKILVLDFGSQYTQLIARRIRELGVYCEIFSYDAPYEQWVDFNPQGIVLSGGPNSAHVSDDFRPDQRVFDLGCPILGICYGMQVMAVCLGGQVSSGQTGEFGMAKVNLHDSQLTLGHEGEMSVWMSHGDQVTHVPSGFSVTGSNAHTPVIMMEDVQRQLYGVQFHPEVTHTPGGQAMFEQFLLSICNIKPWWNSANIIEEQVKRIQDEVGNDSVVLGLSGGVDSSVVAALLDRAIGQQLTCVFVDTGLLRYQESQQVMATFATAMKLHVIRVDARELFFNALSGVEDPEQKRKICGRLFIEVFDKEAQKTQSKWLAQGTIYPDVIESAASKTQKAQVIKSHHNVGGLPKDMNLKLVEPLRDLFKDEVRQVGLTLGLPPEMVFRHPFPGPGLALRVIGEVTQARVETLQQADHIFIDVLRAHGWYDKVAQAFAVYLPLKSVAVVGDQRLYADMICLRAVTTTDFMTAKSAEIPRELLDEASLRIVNEIPNISRVLYDITGKPPATIEWE